MKFYTYIYYDPSRCNEPIYVGKGSGDRAWKHLTQKKMHPFIQRLQKMKRNNVKPVIGLYAGLDEEFAYLLEMELISKFGRKDLDKGSLLNRSDGGEGVRGGITRSMSNIVKIKIGLANKGKVRSKEARENISKSAKGRIPHNKGIPLNQEAKDNLRQKNLGKIRPQSEKDKIRNTMTGQKHEKVECQTCGKLVGIRSVNRYHNNNCKSI